MQTRQQRRQALAQTCQIEQIENIWSIPRNQVMSYEITKIGETYACIFTLVIMALPHSRLSFPAIMLQSG